MRLPSREGKLWQFPQESLKNQKELGLEGEVIRKKD
jgi:hypothetical protein